MQQHNDPHLGPECDENPLAMDNFGSFLFAAVVIAALVLALI